MNERTQVAEGWNDALSEASQHVSARYAAEEEAAEKQKPKSQGPKLAVVTVLFLAVVAWDFRAWVAPPEPMPAAQERENLAWVVADAVESVEDFWVDEGRLPTPADAVDLLGEDITYVVAGDGFSITVEGDGERMTYDGSLSLEEWIASQSGRSSVEQGAGG